MKESGIFYPSYLNSQYIDLFSENDILPHYHNKIITLKNLIYNLYTNFPSCPNIIAVFSFIYFPVNICRHVSHVTFNFNVYLFSNVLIFRCIWYTPMIRFRLIILARILQKKYYVLFSASYQGVHSWLRWCLPDFSTVFQLLVLGLMILSWIMYYYGDYKIVFFLSLPFDSRWLVGILKEEIYFSPFPFFFFVSVLALIYIF